MRIKVIRKPSHVSIDGMRLERFEVGFLYDMGPVLATLFLAEGWGEPDHSEAPALRLPVSDKS
jgi:hypothetical protein